MTSITRAARGGAASRRAPSEAACSDRPRLRAPCLRAAGGGDLGATCEGRPSMHDDAHLVAPSRAISEWISCHLARGARAHRAAREMLALRRLLFRNNETMVNAVRFGESRFFLLGRRMYGLTSYV